MMNPRGKHYEGAEKLIADWRKKRGGPLTLPSSKPPADAQPKKESSP